MERRKIFVPKYVRQYFTDWERVIVALHENDLAGYCTVAKSDRIPNVPYTPYIVYMFVDEKVWIQSH